MAGRSNRYRKMEQYMTCAIVADAVLFVLYLIFAGRGIVWAKVLFAIIAIIVAALILVYLYMTREMFRRRSLWMSTAAAAVVICTLFSLILNYPRPRHQVPVPSETPHESVSETI